MFPGFQYLPVSARSTSLRDGRSATHTGGSQTPRRGGHVNGVLACVADAPIFPAAEIVWERIAGLPESMTAIKHCT
jgi:hypothetical protein